MKDATGKRDWRRPAGWLLGVVVLVVVAYYWGRATLFNAHGPVQLVVYAYSTQEEALTQGIFPAFERAWEAQTGRDLTIEGVFGPSGTLAGQINLGAPADLALFSNAQHVTWLQIGRRVQSETKPVFVGCTPMVIVVRPGLTGITGFADLARPDLHLLHANPQSSGAGEWALLAEYGSALLVENLEAGASRIEQAEAQLGAIWRNVRLMGSSARSTLTLFELGAGDALVTYEQDARLARERGVPLEIVVPEYTIIAQPVVEIVDDNVTRAERPVVEALVNYFLSDAGQRVLRRYHLRPGIPECEDFPPLLHPFTVEDLGGWSLAYTELVERLWQAEIEPRLDLEPGPILLEAGE